ncbi:flagellar basal body P-ring formation chaperone FlgA [Falsiroseomonas selenitidurans]|uniref:Flagellar basal body P-ring formation protein FlgA n=1 Tax=Falsiroseomonas selenitidurans TaxID=2716335 RepID=A0ABX1E4I3_9PROT|nr:flagellar basal body P-ring formation chaperone FlgA [Falsiroseomonas selenitidurans]NKC31693.1 flagellar basal body P-ring formation protein FlgA [Falsiroseomonas selenitidurans]
MRRAALFAWLLLSPLPVLGQVLLPAPAPRAWAPVDGATVTLGDLFENAGPRADATLGPSPAPGRRFVVESPQLAMIARDYGLAWRPLGGEERVVVERPGRVLALETLFEPLKAELVVLGADPAQEIDAPGFTPPTVPANAPEARVAVDDARWAAGSQRFSATLVIVAEGMPTLRQRIAGRTVVMRDAVLATRALRNGETLEEADLESHRMPVDRAPAGAADSLEDLVGQRLRRSLAAGQPVREADVVAVPLVARDQPVLLVVEEPGLSLSAQAVALEDGFRGRAITVLNLSSNQAVRAEVLDRRRVRALGPGGVNQRLAARAAQRDRSR